MNLRVGQGRRHPGSRQISGSRGILNNILSDGNTVANYQPGIGVTGTLNASAWANQIGAAGSLLQASGAYQPLIPSWDWTAKAWNNGVASNTITTPTKTITGNWTKTFDRADADYTPASNVTWFDKLSGNNGFQILLLTTGVIRVRIGDGAAVTNFDSTVANGQTDGSQHIFKITYVDNATLDFTINGVALGTQVVVNKVLTNAAVVATWGPWFNHVYRSTLTNGGATTYYDMNPAESVETSANGATWVASNGETYTLNNSGVTPAMICRSPMVLFDGLAHWMQRQIAGLAQPLTYYLVGSRPTWTAGAALWDGWALPQASALFNASTTTPRVALVSLTEAAINANWPLNTKEVVSAVLSGADSTLTIGSTAATTGNPGTRAPGGVHIGVDATELANFGNLLLSEFTINSGIDSAAKQARVISLLRAIWGTP